MLDPHSLVPEGHLACVRPVTLKGFQLPTPKKGVKQHANNQQHCTNKRTYRGTICAAAKIKDVETDIAIIGAGIIGLCTAYAILSDTDQRVALIEGNRTVPGDALQCGAATGAGQGYIWLAHRDPASAAWQMAAESRASWDRMQMTEPGFNRMHIGWQPSGSLLLAADPTEAGQLLARQELLSKAGISARYLDQAALHEEEPALHDSVADGLLVSSDAQLDGRLAAEALLKACKGSRFIDKRAFQAYLGQPVTELSTDSTGRIETITTSKYRIRLRRAAVIAAGAWTPQLVSMIASAEAPELAGSAIQPRKGHLLEVPAALAPAVKHGLMEIGYAKHYQEGGASVDGMDITFTATQSASGSLLLGSSRELAGFDGSANNGVIEAILERARRFLPALQQVPAAATDVRVGLRPYSSRGLPFVGKLPGYPNTYVAAGHEGSGLTLGPATGSLICNLIRAEDYPSVRESLPAYAAALQV